MKRYAAPFLVVSVRWLWWAFEGAVKQRMTSRRIKLGEPSLETLATIERKSKAVMQ
jgi:hypothetical protein